MFSSGVVKLASGDPTWRNLTALEYHYYTQPLPTPIAWYVHLAAPWFQHGSAVFLFFVELAIPFLIFAPRLWRFVGAGFLILLQFLIALTGNYAFFNLLAVALCFLLFDDAFLVRFFPRGLAERLCVVTPSPRRSFFRRWVTAPVALDHFCGGPASDRGSPLRPVGAAPGVPSAFRPGAIAHREWLWPVRDHDHRAPGDRHSGQQRR